MTDSDLDNYSVQFEAEIFRTAIICSVGLATSFASFVVFRSGLETPYYAVGALFLLFFAVTIGPALITRLFKLRRDYCELTYAVTAVVLLLLPVVLQQISWAVYVTVGLATFCLLFGIPILSVPRISLSLLFDSKPRHFLTPAFLVILCVFAAISAKHSQDVGIFLTEEMGALNLLNRDTVHHIAIANMSTLFGYPTAGLDGGSYLHYHYGMHYWFASVAHSLNLATLTAFPIIHLFVISLMQFSFLLFIQRSLALGESLRESQRLTLSAILMVLCDFILFPGDTAVYYTSESLTLSSGLMFLALLAALSLSSSPPRRSPHLGQTCGFIFLNTFLLVTKLVTAFFFSGALSIYLLLQRVQLKIYAFWILGAFLSSVLALYALTPIFGTIVDAYNPSHLDHPFRLRLGFQLSEKTGGVITCVFLLLTFWLFKRQPERLKFAQSRYLMSLSITLAIGLLIGFFDWFNSLREYLYVLSGLLSVASIIPVLTLLSGRLKPTFYGNRRLLVKGRLVALLGSIGLVCTLGAIDFSRKAINLTNSMAHDLLQVWDGTLGKELSNMDFKDYLTSEIANSQRVFSPEIADRLLQGMWPALAQITNTELQTISRGRFSIFVPPTNVDFWQYSDVDTCTYKPLYIPAVLNVPMIKGLPPKEAPCEYVGIGHDFSGFSAHSHSEDVTQTQLCSYARKKDIERVLILKNFDTPIHYQIVSCQ